MISVGLLISCQNVREAQSVDEGYPPVFPDYMFTSIPYNIAPLNFEVKDAQEIRADFGCGGSSLLTVTGGQEIRIPEKKWKEMLDISKGKELEVTVSVWSSSSPEGVRYRPFTIRVTPDAIDEWIAYRLIEPGYEGWNVLGIYQRNLTSFEEKEIVSNRADKGECINCHSFADYSPQQMMFHVRGEGGGTALWKDGELSKLPLETTGPKKSGTYPMWHPHGRYIVFSSNVTRQSFLSEGEKALEVYDLQSDLILYDTQTKSVLTDPRFMDEAHWETFPAWSADGKWLYYCSALPCQMPMDYKKLRYSLCRVGFDEQTGRFGERIDTIYNAERTGGSVSFPRLSPDGRYLLYTKAACATFPIWHKESDLKMMKLPGGEEVDVEILNSGEAESYHSWSSNSRWILFSSRRLDGRHTRLFIAWMDSEGKVHKPFLLPQQRAGHNTLRMKSYNIPEFVKGEVILPQKQVNALFFPQK